MSLGNFPNITIATVSVGAITLNLQLFWLNPPYMPKVPYFKSKYMLPITAALNLAKLKCRDQVNYESDASNTYQCFFPSTIGAKLKNMSNEMLQYTINANGIHDKPKKYDYSTSIVFLTLFQEGLSVLAQGSTCNYSLKNLLPYESDNKVFGK